MPVITLETRIDAPIELCFDLSRDIDLHMESTAHTGEIAIAGVTAGLIGPDEEVTWQATHFGMRQKLTSRITAYNRPFHFKDSQIRGAFRRFDHDHFFEDMSGATLIRDVFDYDSPLGFLGRLADRLFLTNYMRSLLGRRNDLIKVAAETGPLPFLHQSRRVPLPESVGLALIFPIFLLTLPQNGGSRTRIPR